MLDSDCYEVLFEPPREILFSVIILQREERESFKALTDMKSMGVQR